MGDMKTRFKLIRIYFIFFAGECWPLNEEFLTGWVALGLNELLLSILFQWERGIFRVLLIACEFYLSF